MKVTEKKKLGSLWVIQCDCGNILHSASERDFLPKFGICNKCKDETNN